LPSSLSQRQRAWYRPDWKDNDHFLFTVFVFV
jgi:hypothetical protein